jgi:2-octaprenyl-6-methoxyphenol hydroxylase
MGIESKRIDNTKRYDVIIVGGGMVGMSLGIALAQSQLTIAVVERDDLQSQLLPAFDGRVSAISHGSERVMRSIGVWPYMEAHGQPIYDIRVADGDSLAHVHYNYKEVGELPMGHMVENRHIRAALLRRAEELSLLTIYPSTQLQTLERDNFSATATLENGGILRASLVVAADGKRSRLRDEAGISTIESGYGQTAIVCTIAHEHPHEGLALERFLPAGPFASLPMKGNQSALVWTEANAVAPAIMAMDDETLVAEIMPRLGDWLGQVRPIGKRFSYPLQLTLATRYIDTRLALIGDAAHAIHPIAGQGVNVGFRDVAVMEELITDALRLGLDIGSQRLLEHYQRWRRFDAMSMGAITDGINRLFSNDVAPLSVARRAGLSVVNRTPFLKQLFMKDAMGLLGDLPRMMRAA